MIDQYRWYEHPGFEETYSKVERLRVNVSGRATAVVRNPEYYHSDVVVVLIDPEDDYNREVIAKGRKVTNMLDKEKEWVENHVYAGLDGTYWGGRGQSEPVKDAIDPYIPQRGAAGEEGAELVRIMKNLYYDYFNNGYANIDTYDSEVSQIRNHREKIKSRLLDESNYNTWSNGIADAKGAYDSRQRIKDALPPGYDEALEDVLNAVIMLSYKMIDGIPGGLYKYQNPAMQTYLDHFNPDRAETPDDLIEFFGGVE